MNEELSTVVGRMNGQADSIPDFYDASPPLALGLALRTVGGKEIAEEVLIQAYEEVLQLASPSDRDTANSLSWLSLIAQSKALYWLRSKSPTRPTGDSRYLNELISVV